MTAFRKLAQTCNFCSCFDDSLIRDRLVLGIRDQSIRKKLLQEKKLNLSRAIDIGRSGETTNIRLQEIKKPSATGSDEINAIKTKKAGNQRQRWKLITSAGIVEEVTDVGPAQRMDKPAKSVADRTISPKSVCKVIQANDTHQQIS